MKSSGVNITNVNFLVFLSFLLPKFHNNCVVQLIKLIENIHTISLPLIAWSQVSYFYGSNLYHCLVQVSCGSVSNIGCVVSTVESTTMLNDSEELVLDTSLSWFYPLQRHTTIRLSSNAHKVCSMCSVRECVWLNRRRGLPPWKIELTATNLGKCWTVINIITSLPDFTVTTTVRQWW